SNQGDANVSARGELQRWEINSRIGAEEFEVRIPTGALVYQEEPQQQFIQRADGSRRVITPEERGATYEQYLNSESGEALKAKPTFWRWASWVSAALLCLLASVLLWRQFRRARSQHRGRNT